MIVPKEISVTATITIRRALHDKEHPYAIIPKAFIEDFSISLEAKALLLYCFSRKNDWVFYVSQLASVHKIGDKKIRKLLDEACKAGYVKMIHKYVGNLRRGREYLFDENKMFSNNSTDSPKSNTSEKPLEKDSNLETKTDDSTNVCGTANLETSKKGPLVITDSPISIEEEIHKEGMLAASVSADADFLTHHLIESIKKRDPGFKAPNFDRWSKEMDRLLRIDCRPKEQVLAMIDWTAQHTYWKGSILSPHNLRKHFSTIYIQQSAEFEKTRIRENRNRALAAKEKYPEKLKHLTFDEKYVRNNSLGKEVSFSMETESFNVAFASLFGGKYDRNV